MHRPGQSLPLATAILAVSILEILLLPGIVAKARLEDALAIGLLPLVNLPLLVIGFRAAIRDVNQGCSSARASVVCLLLSMAAAPSLIFGLSLLSQAGGKN